jgi:hypothetical protein
VWGWGWGPTEERERGRQKRRVLIQERMIPILVGEINNKNKKNKKNKKKRSGVYVKRKIIYKTLIIFRISSIHKEIFHEGKKSFSILLGRNSRNSIT